jgi:DNA-binding LytR/AlgR family response regulator
MAIKILILEDEFELAENISDYLNQNGYNVVGIVQNETEFFRIIEDVLVDIVLVDILLKGTSKGFEIAETLKEKFPDCGIIFTTAISSRDMLDKISTTDYHGYILKPFSLKSLESLIYLTAKKQGLTNDVKEQNKTNNLISIREKGKIKLIQQDKIHYIKAEGTYLRIFTDSDTYYVRELIKSMESKLNAEYFIRVQKSYIINLKKVTSFNSKICQVLNQEITIKRGLYKELIEKFSKINKVINKQ